MAKFSTVIVAIAAALTGVQAACPANGVFCGSELKDVYQCISEQQLVALQIDVWRTDLFPTNAQGVVQKATRSCKARGCRNSNGNQQTPPTVFATCN